MVRAKSDIISIISSKDIFDLSFSALGKSNTLWKDKAVIKAIGIVKDVNQSKPIIFTVLCIHASECAFINQESRAAIIFNMGKIVVILAGFSVIGIIGNKNSAIDDKWSTFLSIIIFCF